MDSPKSVFSSPSKPLNPLSPERINQQSPSLSSNLFDIHRKSTRGSSDVQSKVAFLNNLSRNGSPGAAGQQSAGSTAALQRAILGREEAESQLSNVTAQLSEAHSRERRISERLESLLEELQTSKERKAHERTLFEKEIRKARKEAFRAGSAVVKLQDDLKHARSEAKSLKDEVESEREAKEKAEQEAFERAYALAGLTEELEVLKGRLRTAEASIHSHKLEAQARKLRKEEIQKANTGRMSLAEGDLALLQTPAPRRPKRSAEEPTNPPVVESADDSAPPKRPRLSGFTPEKEEPQRPAESQTESQEEIIYKLKDVYRKEKMLRLDAEGLVEYMKVECMLKRCSCRLKEELEECDDHVSVKKPTDSPEFRESAGSHFPETHKISQVQPSHTPFGHTPEPPEEEQMDTDEENMEEPLITFSPETGTFHKIPSPVRVSPKKQHQQAALAFPPSPRFDIDLTAQPQPTSPLARYESTAEEPPFEPVKMEPRDPSTAFSPAAVDVPWDSLSPEHHNAGDFAIHHDNMKRIPLKTENSTLSQFAAAPNTSISREAALAQIRARRSRTNNTSKRSVSVNESSLRSGGMGITPVRVAQRIPGVQSNTGGSQGEKKSRRDMSAPIRMMHR